MKRRKTKRVEEKKKRKEIIEVKEIDRERDIRRIYFS